MQKTRTQNQSVKRTVRLAGAVVIGTIAVSVAYLALSPNPQTPALRFDEILPAVAAYTQDNQQNGTPLPDEISLQTLMELGYLPQENHPSTAEIFVSLNARSDPLPQDVLMRAVFPDGEQLALLGDGSVQHWSDERARISRRDIGSVVPEESNSAPSTP